MGNKGDKIRIIDIAKLAGVSAGTVDRVIHGRAGVSQKSKEKVEQVLQEINYTPNKYASALALNKKILIGCLIPQHKPEEYWDAIEDGINLAKESFSDFHLSVETIYYDPFNFNDFITKGEALLMHEPDGIVLTPTEENCSREFTQKLEQKRIPYIYIDSSIEQTNPLAFFGQNSSHSGYIAGKLLMFSKEIREQIVIFRLLKKGVVGSNQQENREIGFRQYIHDFHPNCQIKTVDLTLDDLEYNHHLLHSFFKENPTIKGGVTFNSKAYIVSNFLKKEPRQEFLLIGYDLLKPNIVSLKEGNIVCLIAQRPELQGSQAIETMCKYLIFKEEVIQNNFMPIDLITRENIDYYRAL